MVPTSGAVAQPGERFNGIEEVGGSSPPSSTTKDKWKNFSNRIFPWPLKTLFESMRMDLKVR